MKAYRVLAQRVKHMEFWLPVVLLLILTFMFNFIQWMYVDIFNLLVGFYSLKLGLFHF